MHDETVVPLPRPGEIAGLQRHERERSLPGKEDFDLPEQEDRYVAHGRVSNREEVMLCLYLGNETYDCLPYSDLKRIRMVRSGTSGRAMVLQFLTTVITEVRIEGRNLLELFHNLRRHRIPWVREAPDPRQLMERGLPIITRITVTDAAR